MARDTCSLPHVTCQCLCFGYSSQESCPFGVALAAAVGHPSAHSALCLNKELGTRWLGSFTREGNSRPSKWSNSCWNTLAATPFNTISCTKKRAAKFDEWKQIPVIWFVAIAQGIWKGANTIKVGSPNTGEQSIRHLRGHVHHCDLSLPHINSETVYWGEDKCSLDQRENGGNFQRQILIGQLPEQVQPIMWYNNKDSLHIRCFMREVIRRKSHPKQFWNPCVLHNLECCTL